ncbi:citryl-CoA lyase [Halomarina halobia]|uniref:Citryl-CoA lyase n=1 Tax=Halomarina halobia TaxID=3033386 RepID=A0ABD6AE76_9EURY|nr:citryl-CoA lyase [Halomarina sp. PSR21]
MSDYQTALSTYDAESVTVRDRDLTSEIMGELDFGSTTYLLLKGTPPRDGEGRLVNAMLASLMVHGVTPHALAARLTYLAEPESIQGAVASGLLGVGTRYVGAMQECAAVLQAAGSEPDRESAVRAIVSEYAERGDPFPGIGHPFHKPVDPRAERLFALAEEEGLAGDHVALVRDVQSAFEERTGKELPVNVTGAIAAVCSDIDLPPEAARGLAVISRATGLVAEVIEEQSRPIAADVWHRTQERMTYSGDR